MEALAKRKNGTKYVLPLGLAIIVGLILINQASALPGGGGNGGGGNAAPSGTIEIVVQPASIW